MSQCLLLFDVASRSLIFVTVKSKKMKLKILFRKLSKKYLIRFTTQKAKNMIKIRNKAFYQLAGVLKPFCYQIFEKLHRLLSRIVRISTSVYAFLESDI